MQTAFPSPLQEVTQSLIEHLLASEAFLRYRNASAQFNEDNEAQALLKQLTKSQARLRQMQGQGKVNQAEVDALRLLQQRDPTQSRDHGIRPIPAGSDQLSARDRSGSQSVARY